MQFVVIGITDRPKPFFPPEVTDIIGRGKVFSGGRRHHEIMAPLLPADAEWIDITVPLDAVFEQYKNLADGYSRRGEEGTVIVFASGDPLFFGFANTIMRKMPEAGVTVYPSFNSLQMLAHRLLMPYHDMHVVSLTGRPWPAFDRELIGCSPMIGVLTDREHTPAAIARRMLDYGYDHYSMHIGEHLGHPEKERVTTLSLQEAAQRDFSQPNCLILVLRSQSTRQSTQQSTQQSTRQSTRPFGLPDNSFALLDGREKMITKMPIRLLTLQALDLPRRHVLWDIGACTGSVSIEARLLFPHLQIEAFEIRPECEAIIRENMLRHGAPGISLHIGDFLALPADASPPTGFASPPAGSASPSAGSASPSVSVGVSVGCLSRQHLPPDAVFIGGHGGHLKEIMAKVRPLLAPGGVIVMNSVSSPVVDRLSHRPSSRQLFEEACRELGLVLHPATHIVLNDFNPIDILKCELPQ